MLRFPDNLNDCHALLGRMVIELVGGDEVAGMLIDHHQERMTLDELAGKYEMHRDAVHRRVVKARVRLRRVGLLPPQWDSPRPAGAMQRQAGGRP